MAPSAASMSQLNVRLDPQAKAAGDATLERMGVTPTQFVRAIWNKLALGAQAFDQLASALVLTPGVIGDAQESLTTRGDSVVQRIVERQASLEHELGLTPTTYTPLSEEDMEDLLYEEALLRERERMTWHAE